LIRRPIPVHGSGRLRHSRAKRFIGVRHASCRSELVFCIIGICRVATGRLRQQVPRRVVAKAGEPIVGGDRLAQGFLCAAVVSRGSNVDVGQVAPRPAARVVVIDIALSPAVRRAGSIRRSRCCQDAIQRVIAKRLRTRRIAVVCDPHHIAVVARAIIEVVAQIEQVAGLRRRGTRS
jgi:hypothetical protein